MKLSRKIFLKTTNFTHGSQNERTTNSFFYRLWASLHDISVKLDPAYSGNLTNMVNAVVVPGNITLDVGCGTGLGTLLAAKIAQTVVGIDSSADMLNKLRKKIKKQNISNIEIHEGLFPEAFEYENKFGSIISSFMLAYLSKEQRTETIKAMFEMLEIGGAIGLFSVQGEIASSFQTKKEIEFNLSNAGFSDIVIVDIDDIYRMTTAIKI